MDQYKLAVECLKETLREQLQYVQPTTVAHLLTVLVTLRVGTRLYYINEDMIREHLWPMFRADNDLVDVVMNISSDYYTRVKWALAVSQPLREGEEGPRIGDFYESLGQSYAWLSSSARVTDEEFISKIPDDDGDVSSLLLQEHWLFAVLMMVRNLSAITTLFTRITDPEGLPAQRANRESK